MQGFARAVKKNADGTIADKAYEEFILSLLPLGYWRMQEPSGTNIDDDVDKNGAAEHDGTVGGTGVTLNQPGPIAGDVTSRSLAFAGAGWVDMGDNFDFAATAPFSIAVWVKPTTIDGTYRRMVTKEITDGAGLQGYGMYARAGTGFTFFRYRDGVGEDLIYANNLAIGTWQLGTAVYDGTSMRLYLNRSLVAGPMASSRSLLNHAGPFRVGATGSGTQPWSGNAAEPMVFNFALSETQVQAIYDAGVAAAGYTTLEVDKALKTSRREQFRYELHRYGVPETRVATMEASETWVTGDGSGLQSQSLDVGKYKQGSSSLRISVNPAASARIDLDLVPDRDLSAASLDQIRIWVFVADASVSAIYLLADSTNANYSNYYQVTLLKSAGWWTVGKWIELRIPKASFVVGAGSPTWVLTTRLGIRVSTTGTSIGTAYFDDWRWVNSASVAWNVVANLKTVRGCQIEYNRLGRVKRTARMEILEDGSIDYVRDAIRCFWMVQMPDGFFAEWKVGTFLVGAPVRPLAVGAVRQVEGYDSLLALEQAKLANWYVVPVGANVIAAVIALITTYASNPVAGVQIPASAKTMVNARTYEPGETVLTVANELLSYCGYSSLRANEDGSFVADIAVLPSTRGSEFTYADDLSSIIVSGSVELTADIFNAPNQWVRVVSRPEMAPIVGVAALTDPANPLSQAYRGRLITDYNTLDLPDQTTLNNHVKNLAEEGQFVFNQWKMETPLMPHSHADVLTLQHTKGGEDNGVYMEHTWTMDMRPGGKMVHTLDKIISAAT